jgi:hypothetical protein
LVGQVVRHLLDDFRINRFRRLIIEVYCLIHSLRV